MNYLRTPMLPPLTLNSSIGDLKATSLLSRNAIFELREMGAMSVRDILRLNPLDFMWRKGISKDDFFDIIKFQLNYRELLDFPMLSVAREICRTAHEGQVDKEGQPYYLHPERVAARCETVDEKIVALLHDTIEDTDVTPEYLLGRGFPDDIVEAVLSVTKREAESYEDFVARAKQNGIGRKVKIHDLEDNMDLTRLSVLSDSMIKRFHKYLKAYHFLKS